jgi:CBS domain-containing protein
VGIVTEGDFLRRAETGTQRQRPSWLEYLIGPGRLADEYTRSHGRKVGEVMTPDPVTLSEETPLEEAVRLHDYRRTRASGACRGRGERAGREGSKRSSGLGRCHVRHGVAAIR